MDTLTRSSQTIAASSDRIARGVTRVEKSRRRVLPRVGGGSTEGDGATYVPERLAHLPKDRPSVFAGPSLGNRNCDCCGHSILRGSTEYELDFKALLIHLDRQCFAMYQTELMKQ